MESLTGGVFDALSLSSSSEFSASTSRESFGCPEESAFEALELEAVDKSSLSSGSLTGGVFDALSLLSFSLLSAISSREASTPGITSVLT